MQRKREEVLANHVHFLPNMRARNPELARTEVVKRIWAYIKEKHLQDPTYKRKILCYEMLRKNFRVKTIDMFQMSKALTKRIWLIKEEFDEPEQSAKSKGFRICFCTSNIRRAGPFLWSV
ncbi:protein TRI1-like [Rutidosis leptorrhynchoides]|uniref:protein TRI1-like n=1 Tax=Rutidosis leptorrhynchoides TaxID=125765 RepID=UPI003A995DD1